MARRFPAGTGPVVLPPMDPWHVASMLALTCSNLNLANRHGHRCVPELIHCHLCGPPFAVSTSGVYVD